MAMFSAGLFAVATSVCMLLLPANSFANNNGVSAWMNPNDSPVVRATALLAELSLEEKIAMTFATHTGSKIAAQFNTTGVGAVKYMSAFGCSDIVDCINQRNTLQSLFLNQSAHGIPISFINEGLHGGAPGGTIFPEPIGQGMSWNVSMVSAIASAIAYEAASIGVDTVFAPVVNMMPDPRFGRLQEGFGENPTVTCEMATASVEGLQGVNKGPAVYREDDKVCSLGKHFAAYGAAIGALNGGPADVSNRTLHEVYLRPWISLSQAGVRAVMPSHNTVHDIPAHANEWLIKRTLRQEFGLTYGVALSDCNDIGAIFSSGMAMNRSQAAALALTAGVDWDLQCGPDSQNWGYFNYLKQAIDEGQVSESVLDVTVMRVLVQKFAANLFDQPFVSPDKAKDLDSAAHRQLAYESAVQSIVLLQNDKQTLPMNLKGKKITVFGPIASESEAETALVGSYVLSGAKVVTVTEALNMSGAASVEYYQGTCAASGVPGNGCGNLTVEAQLAKNSDIAILVLGDGHGVCGEWGDRDSLDLAGGQLQLLEAVAGLATKTIVVLVHGRPQTFGLGNAVLSKVDALLSAWRPGEEGGNAIVDIITGKGNPSAKLVQSWPQTVGQVGGPSTPWLQRTRGKWVANGRGCVASEGGRCYDAYVNDGYPSTPLFPFGFGLSYSTFEFKSVSVQTPASDILSLRLAQAQDVVLNVSVTVANTGTVDGSEVVQVYVQDPGGLPFVPFWRRLLGFNKVFVKAGETVTTVVEVKLLHLAQYDADMTLRVFAGDYNIFVGDSSDVTPLTANVTI
eukprot:m.262177 g.262177  ORF g.262177 m.262177 type:complete len:794 (-) comp44699_c0_seq1:67-2448(-)